MIGHWRDVQCSKLVIIKQALISSVCVCVRVPFLGGLITRFLFSGIVSRVSQLSPRGGGVKTDGGGRPMTIKHGEPSHNLR